MSYLQFQFEDSLEEVRIGHLFLREGCWVVRDNLGKLGAVRTLVSRGRVPGSPLSGGFGFVAEPKEQTVALRRAIGPNDYAFFLVYFVDGFDDNCIELKKTFSYRRAITGFLIVA